VVTQATRVGSFKAAHSVSAAHAWHFSMVPQIGVAPEQYAAEVHWTQLFVVVSQAGVVPVHFVAFVAVHWTQAPLAAQEARAGSFNPVQSVSTAHAWHLSVAPQMGVAPEQLVAATHWTQVLVLVSQAEVVPVQEALDVAVH